MQITRVEAFPLRYREPNDNQNLRYITLARVETNDGAVGWGECISQWPESAQAVKIIVERGLAPVLLGRDPRETEALWQAMKAHTWWYGDGGIASFALSALDMACWDLKGKALGVPLYQLLGGKVNAKLRACASTHPNRATIDALAAELAGYAQQGYTALKVGFGKRGEARLGMDPARDVAFVEAAREAIGPNVDLMVDIGNGVKWDTAHAIRMAREFQRFQIRWYEEPLHPNNDDGYARLRHAVDLPIATGEREWTVAGYRRLIRSGVADIIMVDPGRAEGVTGFQKVIQLTAQSALSFNAHTWSSAINTAASLHLTASAPNYIVFELKPLPSPMQHELVTNPIEQKDGWVSVPEGPGLGIEVDERVVRKYLFD
jgi:L-alanine-DL-glutamate epimerase-like enolase superfamily enzyme